MNLTTTLEGHERIAEAVNEATKIEATEINGGAGYQLELRVRSTEYTLRYYTADGRWRWTWISTYGNLSGIAGAGCDASGFRVTDDDLLEILDQTTTDLLAL